MASSELKKGVSKLFLSEIFMLVSSVLTVVIESFEGKLGTQAVIAIAAFILVILSAVFNITGLGKLRKTNKNLNEAFWLTIGLVAVAVLSAVLPKVNGKLFTESTFKGTQNVIEILIGFSIIDGIREAVPAVNALGKKTLIVFGIFSICGILVEFLNKESGLAIGIGIVGIICELIYGISYIIFLGKAKKAAN